MSFGLKITDATYQKLMDRIFKNHKERNLEVYIDDILIKSTTAKAIIIDIKEIFATLRRYDLKLNLEKCIFGIGSECFLGYMITERGIEANPTKVQALQNMKAL